MLSPEKKKNNYFEIFNVSIIFNLSFFSYLRTVFKEITNESNKQSPQITVQYLNNIKMFTGVEVLKKKAIL